MSSQLWRAVLDGSSLSADQQDAAPDKEGSYGALVEAIDEIVSSPKRSQSRRRKPTRENELSVCRTGRASRRPC
jgi:hypothetical protein